MKRREALSAKDEDRAPRTLYAWDYLIGVQDFTRQGALRLRRERDSHFLADHPRSAPPVASLRELEAVAKEIRAAVDDFFGDSEFEDALGYLESLPPSTPLATAIADLKSEKHLEEVEEPAASTPPNGAAAMKQPAVAS